MPDELLNFLNFAALAMGIEIDRVAVRRAICGGLGAGSEAQLALRDWTLRLSQSAAGFRIRIDSLELSFAEAADLVRHRAPIGALWRSSDGSLRWALLTDSGDGRIQIIDSISDPTPRNASRQILQAVVAGAAGEIQWLSLQPSYPCDTLVSHHGLEPSPLARYLRLLAPERSDIAVILVFALFVGLLALSTPIAVEALVNTVAFGQFVQPVIVLSLILFVFMAFSATIRAVQTYVAEIIQRRLFVRVAADLAQRIPRVEAAFWHSHYGPEAVNRFFETVTVQKVTTQLLLDGTALILQALVGMTVIAFYHPVFLGFDAFLLVLLGIIVFVLGRNAVTTSTDESRQKYATAAWLEELARHPTLFRSRGGLVFALDRADYFVTQYLTARATHFRILMRQIVAALFVQAVASTLLLGLGGWLVIRGELTLGQLVAAELIVTLIVGSFAKVGKQLDGFYDLMASMEKLGHLFDLPLERLDGVELPESRAGIELAIHDVSTPPLATGQAMKNLSVMIAAGEQCALVGEPTGLNSLLLEAIAGYRPALSGFIELDGIDLRRLRLDSVRDQVTLLREVEVFAGTIAENLHLGRDEVSEHDIRAALESSGLLQLVLDLPQGLETVLQTDGAQFSSDQLVRLMVARAIAGRPRLLLIDGLLDRLSDAALPRTIAGLLSNSFGMTLIVATGRREVAEHFKRCLRLAGDGSLYELSEGRVRVPQSR